VQASAQKYDQHSAEYAVSLARKGDYDRALALLREIIAKEPGNVKVIRDYVVVLGWAGKDAEVLSLEDRIAVATAPSYVINTLAKSARNLRLFDKSIELYRQALLRNPKDLQSSAGLALALTDAGRPGDAQAILAPLLRAHPENNALLLAEAYAYRSGGETLQAFWTNEAVLSHDPENKDAIRRRMFLLSTLGAPGLALSMAQSRPDLFSEEELGRIESDLAAVKVRWGRLYLTKDRFEEIDQALEMIQTRYTTLIREEGRSPSSPQVLRNRFDYIEALRARYRMNEVIQEYDKLRENDVQLPVRVLIAVGDAFLYLEQPEKAIEVYTQALEMEPNDYIVRYGLFWACIDMGDFDRAQQIIDKMVAEQPVWEVRETGNGQPMYMKNDKRLEAESTAIMARAFADDLDSSQKRLEEMVNKAPFNRDLREKLGHVYLWRGWHRLALEEFEIVLATDPENMYARLGKAEALMELKEYRDAEPLIADLEAGYPENRGVQKLKRAWELYNKRILTTSAGYGQDNARNENVDSIKIDTYLYSRPIRYNVRLFIHGFWENAEIEGETARNISAGAGVRYEIRGHVLSLEINKNEGSKNGLDLEGWYDWQVNDQATIGVSYDSFSDAVPLKGRLNGITGWSTGLDGVYRFHESAEVGFNVLLSEFSDGNVRKMVIVSGMQRMYNSPYFKVPVTVELYSSANTKEDRPYFNPKEDFSGLLTVDFRWLMWRRYERSFLQRLALTGGRYWQKDYDAKNIWSIRYEHDWDVSDSLSLLYGVTWSQRAFDGSLEDSLWTYFDMIWRF